MNDNEIVKELENKVRGSDWGGFDDDDLLDLINRKQAEIERLHKEVGYWEAETKEARTDIDQAVAEAIKEFAERLCEGRVSNDPVVIAAKVELKEMVGDTE